MREKMEKKSEKLLQNTIIFMAGNLSSKLIQFLLVPLYTYTLTTDQFGATELVLTAVNVLMPVFSISVSDGLLRFGLDKNQKKEQVMKSAVLIVSAGTAFSILFTPLFVQNRMLGDWVVCFLIILNLRIYRDILSVYLKIQDKNRIYAADSVLYTLILCILNILFLVVLKCGILGYFLSYIAANLCSIVFLILKGKPEKEIVTGKTDRKLLKAIALYSLPMVANAVSWNVVNASDRFMIEYFLSASAVGLYSVAAKIPSFITTFTGVFGQAWTISAVVEYEKERERDFYAETFHRYYVLLFFGAACMLLLLKPFMSIYVSEDYYDAWRYIPFLVCSAVFSSVSGFMGGIYAALKKNVNVTVTTIISALANVLLNAALIPKTGIMGAAAATYLSWLMIAVIRIFDIRRYFWFPIRYKALIGYTLLLLFQSAVVLICGEWCGAAVSFFCICILAVCEKRVILQMGETLLKRIGKRR